MSFNGIAHEYADHPILVHPGELLRFYVVDAGPNRISAFHVVGAIFSKVYPDGVASHAWEGVQTATVPPGGRAMTLIRVAETTKNGNLFFFFCGLFREEGYSRESYAKIQSLMAACPENMHFVSGFIEDEGIFNSLFNSADIIFAAFNKFYSSSNTLTKAAFFKKPVVVSKGYCMAERVEKYNLGIPISEADAIECSKALNELESKYGAYVNRADFTTYYNLHSEPALLQIVRTII